MPHLCQEILKINCNENACDELYTNDNIAATYAVKLTLDILTCDWMHDFHFKLETLITRYAYVFV